MLGRMFGRMLRRLLGRGLRLGKRRLVGMGGGRVLGRVRRTGGF